MIRFLVRILANSLAIYLAAYFVENFTFTTRLSDWRLLLIAGLILALINTFLKPILKIISAPLIILTLGLFSLVINLGLLWLLTQFLPQLEIQGFWAYFWGTLIITFLNWLVNALTKKHPKTN